MFQFIPGQGGIEHNTGCFRSNGMTEARKLCTIRWACSNTSVLEEPDNRPHNNTGVSENHRVEMASLHRKNQRKHRYTRDRAGFEQPSCALKTSIHYLLIKDPILCQGPKDRSMICNKNKICSIVNAAVLQMDK